MTMLQIKNQVRKIISEGTKIDIVLNRLYRLYFT